MTTKHADELDTLIEKIANYGDKPLTEFEKELLALNFTLLNQIGELRKQLVTQQAVLKLYEAAHDKRSKVN